MVAVAGFAAWPIYRAAFVPAPRRRGCRRGRRHRRRSPGCDARAGRPCGRWWGSRFSGWACRLPYPPADSPPGLLPALDVVGAGALFAWKDLSPSTCRSGRIATCSCRAIVFLVGPCAGLLLSWRRDRVAYAAVPVALAMISFGLFFGRTTVSSHLHVGPLTLAAPLETALGVTGLLACMLWLAWRSRDERMRALRRAAASGGVRDSRWSSRFHRRRLALGAGMIAVAVARRGDRGAAGCTGGAARCAACHGRARAGAVDRGEPAGRVPGAVRRRPCRPGPVHGRRGRRVARTGPPGHARRLRR